MPKIALQLIVLLLPKAFREGSICLPTTGLEVIGRILGAVVALALVLVAAWMLITWLGKRVPGMASGSAVRLVKVLDRVNVGRSSCILLLRVQDKVLLVAMTEHGTEKLCEFDDPSGSMMPANLGEIPAFSAALKDAALRLVGKEAKPAQKSGDTPNFGGETPEDGGEE